jgi:FkbM family methyltransferase
MNLIFDIGANVGKTVAQFITVANKVVCFEPNPMLVNNLKSRFANDSVIVDERGVSNKNGTQTFKISNADTISTLSEDWVTNSRFTGSYNWDNHIQIETVTLDSIIEQYGTPDYIKIDVEGHEYELLASFTKFLPYTLFAFEWAEEQKAQLGEKGFLQEILRVFLGSGDTYIPGSELARLDQELKQIRPKRKLFAKYQNKDKYFLF